MKKISLFLSLFLLQTMICYSQNNVALSSNGGTATASSMYPGYTASEAIDGSMVVNDGWLSANTTQPQWLQVEFDQTYVIDRIVCVFEGTQNQNQTYQLEYWDGNSWELIESVIPSSDTTVSFSFAPITTTQIRYYCTIGKDNGYAYLTEIQAYGEVSNNVALSSNGGTATASSMYSGYAASEAIDGSLDVNDGWLSANTTQPQWLQVEFDQTYAIDRIVCVFEGLQNQNQTYQLEYWDGNSWELIESVIPSSDTTVSFSFAPITTTQIRYYCTIGKDNGYAYLTEIQAYGEVSNNIALSSNGGTATASSMYSGYAASEAIDGSLDVNDGWLSANTTQPQWLQVEFDQSYAIDRIVCVFEGLQNQNQTYQLEYWDGNSWELIESVIPSSDTTVSFSFAPITTTQIRYYCTIGKDNGYAYLTEIQAYGVPSMIVGNSLVKDTHFEFYPNPSSDYIHFDDNVKSLKFFDLQSILVKEIEVVDNVCDISDLALGTYLILSCDNEENVSSSLFIKQ